MQKTNYPYIDELGNTLDIKYFVEDKEVFEIVSSKVDMFINYKNCDLYKGKGKGIVQTRWSDVYDWNQGQGFRIPGTGMVSDDDGIYLKEHGGAKDFLLESSWESSFEGVYNPNTDTWESIEWKD